MNSLVLCETPRAHASVRVLVCHLLFWFSRLAPMLLGYSINLDSSYPWFQAQILKTKTSYQVIWILNFSPSRPPNECTLYKDEDCFSLGWGLWMLTSLLCLNLRLHPATLMLLWIGAGSFSWWIQNSHAGHRLSIIQVGTKRPNFLSRKSDKWNDEDFL